MNEVADKLLLKINAEKEVMKIICHYLFLLHKFSKKDAWSLAKH